MDKLESLSHTAWDCKYHVIFIPKRRRKTLYGELRRHLGEVFRKQDRAGRRHELGFRWTSAGLDQDHAGGRILAQPSGDDRPGRTSSDDGEVCSLGHGISCPVGGLVPALR